MAPRFRVTENDERTADDVRRGDIYWIDTSDERSGAMPVAHPHVVVQEDVFNRSRLETVVVCAVTSNLTRASEPGNLLLDPGEGGLERRSVVVVSQISSVLKSRLGRRLGRLAPVRVDVLIEGLAFQQRAFQRASTPRSR